jgi:thiol-disulfide isomerase/thioredoxin
MSYLRAVLALSVSGAAACAGTQEIPADARTTIVSLKKIDCADCGEEIVADLRARPGVYGASFNKRKAEIKVIASPSFDVPVTVKRLAAMQGFVALVGAGQGEYLGWAAFPEGADVQTVATEGQDVPELSRVLASGKVTVVDFSAGWCGPCRALDKHMVKVLSDHPAVAYRKLDIGDWDTPLAQRYLKNISQLPYVIVYDARGAKTGEVIGLDLGKLDAAIARSAQQSAAAEPSRTGAP